MGPEFEAACRFAEDTGGRVVIGAFEDAVQMPSGEAGTIRLPRLEKCTYFEWRISLPL
jgi:carbamate kinase